MTQRPITAFQKLGGLYFLPRTLQKIRLHARGELPADYVPYLGAGFDRRCLNFLRIDFAALVARVAAGGTDAEILEWCFASSGHRPTEFEILVWNEYMIKRGWRDTDAPAGQLEAYKANYGLGHRADIVTFFDFYEIDEGRKP